MVTSRKWEIDVSGYIEKPGHRVPIYAWTDGVPFDPKAEQQVRNLTMLPIVHKHVAIMPDVHFGIGATVGSVIATKRAVIPAAVGVDIGCGMMAVKLSRLNASSLPDSLSEVRSGIEATVPVGFGKHLPKDAPNLPDEKVNHVVDFIRQNHPKLGSRRKMSIEDMVTTQFGTLGGGNHFIELCLDTDENVWVMLHSGSRGIGNTIGQYFIALAKQDMRHHDINLPDKDLSYLSEGTKHFNDYIEMVGWAQDYAKLNREAMMSRIIKVLRKHLPHFVVEDKAVNCHHNYVVRESHFEESLFITRKGAVSAKYGQLGIIPGSMGAKSFIVKGRGNPHSFHSCSHGAGRVMSRTQAKKEIMLGQHQADTYGVECRKDLGVVDESPAAYKSIDAVMRAQADLVDVVATLRQVVCVKG